MKNKSLFKKHMKTFNELYDKNISKGLLDVYWDALDVYSDEECEKGFKEIIKSCVFFPKPAEIINLIEKANKCKTPVWY